MLLNLKKMILKNQLSFLCFRINIFDSPATPDFQCHHHHHIYHHHHLLDYIHIDIITTRCVIYSTFFIKSSAIFSVCIM